MIEILFWLSTGEIVTADVTREKCEWVVAKKEWADRRRLETNVETDDGPIVVHQITCTVLALPPSTGDCEMREQS